MEANEKIINTFATRVRQMILQYQDLKQENVGLYAKIDEQATQIRNLQNQLTRLQHDFDTLKMARMIQISDGDLESSRKRLAKLIRDLNKCITLLSDKQ